jgi:hypothetical protein
LSLDLSRLRGLDQLILAHFLWIHIDNGLATYHNETQETLQLFAFWLSFHLIPPILFAVVQHNIHVLIDRHQSTDQYSSII